MSFVESKIHTYKISQCKYCLDHYPECKLCGKQFFKNNEKIYCSGYEHLCEECYGKNKNFHLTTLSSKEDDK